MNYDGVLLPTRVTWFVASIRLCIVGCWQRTWPYHDVTALQKTEPRRRSSLGPRLRGSNECWLHVWWHTVLFTTHGNICIYSTLPSFGTPAHILCHPVMRKPQKRAAHLSRTVGPSAVNLSRFRRHPRQPWLILSDKAWCAQEVHDHKEGAVQWYETNTFPENDYACSGCLYLPRAVANLLERERGPLIADFLFFHNLQSGNEKYHVSSIPHS